MSDLETLLSIYSGNSVITKNDKPIQPSSLNTHQAKGMLRANKSASLDDFISMIAKLVHLVIEDYEVEFLPNENQHVIINPDQKIDKTYISYSLISRVPSKEIKPMIREEIREHSPTNREEDRNGYVYGQDFKSIVQFNIFSSNYKVANKVMKQFEDMIFTFTGYMKSNGIKNILFKEQITDSNFDIYRKSLSVRNLRYNVDTENLTVIFNEKIRAIITEGNLDSESNKGGK